MSDPNLTLHYNFAVDQSLTARIGPTLSIVRTTPATFFNSSGLIETAASGKARFEYDPITRISKGLFVEEARTNDCLHNRDGTNAVWVKLNMTAAKDQIGEDGVANSATSLLATAGNATAIQSFTIVSTAQTSTFSIKRLIGTGNVDITIDDGVTFTTVNINSLTYTRFDVTQTLANPDIGVRLVTSGDKIAIDFQGLEAGAFPTSRIATVASPVPRNDDSIFTTDVSWFTQATGTWLFEYTRNMTGTGAMVAEITGGATIPNHFFLSDSNNDGAGVLQFAGRDGAIQWLMDAASAENDGTLNRAALGYKENDIAGFLNGDAGVTDALATPPGPMTRLDVGSRDGNSLLINGHLAGIRFYNDYEGGANGRQFLESLSSGIINEDSINLSSNLARPIARKIAHPY